MEAARAWVVSQRPDCQIWLPSVLISLVYHHQCVDLDMGFGIRSKIREIHFHNHQCLFKRRTRTLSNLVRDIKIKRDNLATIHFYISNSKESHAITPAPPSFSLHSLSHPYQQSRIPNFEMSYLYDQRVETGVNAESGVSPSRGIPPKAAYISSESSSSEPLS